MSSDVLHEDIAKKFELPERKTKIDTLLKMQGVKPLYCICQSADITRFMICCEKCDEWYHGDCIDLEEKDAKNIKKWYCSNCVLSYGLEVIYFSPAARSFKKKKKSPKASYDQESEDSRCGQCSNCLQNDECGNKDYCFTQKRHRYHDKEAHTISNGNNTNGEANHLREKRNKVRNKRKRKHPSDWKPKLCYGPQCPNGARLNSKYCSDECGLALARMRILSILPQRVAANEQTPSLADFFDKAKLDKLRMQKRNAYEELRKLNRQEKKLLDLITKSKHLPIVESKEEIDEESKMYCITCGCEIPSRSAIKHMETCFKKIESKAAVVGVSKTTYCDIFCEYYDSAKKTYCKRLRFVCPEHYKPKKVEENEVCGCPIIEVITTSIFSGPKKFCQQPKKKCNQHYNWEILAFSEIDLDRLRQWNKIHELVDEEDSIRRQMTNRNGALGHLLHSTEISDYST